MLKTVSSITNAIGALNFKGTWDANANSPALASSVGTKGDYYVVGTAGSTNLNGISNWGVGDLATFNGSVWQRVEGGADLNGVNLSVSGTSTLSGLTASTALALNPSKENVSVTNTGTGNNVLATAPTLVGDVTLSTGNLVIGTSGKGIDFSATAGTGTSELLADYEEGTFTPTIVYSGTNTPAYGGGGQLGRYTKIGRIVEIQIYLSWDENGSTGNVTVGALPFTSVTSNARAVPSILSFGLLVVTSSVTGFVNSNATTILLTLNDNAATVLSATNTGANQDMYLTVTYEAA